MKIETNPKVIQGICELFPETKKERKLTCKLYSVLKKENGNCVALRGEKLILRIYNVH